MQRVFQNDRGVGSPAPEGSSDAPLAESHTHPSRGVTAAVRVIGPQAPLLRCSHVGASATVARLARDGVTLTPGATTAAHGPLPVLPPAAALVLRPTAPNVAANAALPSGPWGPNSTGRPRARLPQSTHATRQRACYSVAKRLSGPTRRYWRHCCAPTPCRTDSSRSSRPRWPPARLDIGARGPPCLPFTLITATLQWFYASHSQGRAGARRR